MSIFNFALESQKINRRTNLIQNIKQMLSELVAHEIQENLEGYIRLRKMSEQIACEMWAEFIRVLNPCL